MIDKVGPPERVAFLGLGQMGLHMATAIANAGFAVRGWTRSMMAPMAEISFEFIADVELAVRDASVIVVCVRDDVAVTELLFESGLAELIKPGSIVIDMGTSGVDVAQEHSKRLASLDIGYLDAPVSGGSQGAKDARLAIFVGGDTVHFERAKPVLLAMGTPYHLGKPGTGQAGKLANQIIVGITIAAVAEGLAFAEAQGVAGQALLSALGGGFAASTVLNVHGPRMVARDYTAAGAVRLHLKDLRLVDRAHEIEQLPHAAMLKSGFEHLADGGFELLDHSSYAKLYQTPAGESAT
jgi:2-hydroxy-3-oxopropionate reductase